MEKANRDRENTRYSSTKKVSLDNTEDDGAPVWAGRRKTSLDVGLGKLVALQSLDSGRD